MEICFLYVTCGDRETAMEIARKVVGERLAACANLLPGMTSCYWWEGKLEEDEEVVLILKTSLEQVESATKRVVELHPYEVPCVLQLPVSGGNEPYLKWLENNLSPS